MRSFGAWDRRPCTLLLSWYWTPHTRVAYSVAYRALVPDCESQSVRSCSKVPCDQSSNRVSVWPRDLGTSGGCRSAAVRQQWRGACRRTCGCRLLGTHLSHLTGPVFPGRSGEGLQSCSAVRKLVRALPGDKSTAILAVQRKQRRRARGELEAGAPADFPGRSRSMAQPRAVARVAADCSAPGVGRPFLITKPILIFRSPARGRKTNEPPSIKEAD